MRQHLAILTINIMFMGSVGLFLSPSAFGSKIPDVSMSIRIDNVNVRAGAEGERAMEILLQAPEDADYLDATALPPMKIALVIDRSGSMQSEGKMAFVKDAARSIVERLRGRDSMALIAYDDRAEVIIPMQPARDKAFLFDRINSLYPRGSTNLGAGLLAGYREINIGLQSNCIKRVILLSDGLANRGITSVQELSRITGGNYEEGMALSTMGVGTGFNEDLMTTLAIDGGGMYYYIDRPSRIPDIMAREFSAMQTLLASNIILRVELSAKIGIRKIIGNRYEERDRTIEYNVGELSVGERRRYMLHLDIPELAEGEHNIAKVSLRYAIPGQKKGRAITRPVYLNAMTDRSQINMGKNDQVIERVYIFAVNEARRLAAMAVDRGNTEEAVKVLAAIEKRLAEAPLTTDRLAREKKSIEKYATNLKHHPRGSKLREVQKRVKYKIYALEGC
ncbi:MAG: VWA domain-containing protein [Desulfobacteraceae bacterium]|nr:VWA domain-containing protein [Desulfobacteraceae bacterium]